MSRRQSRTSRRFTVDEANATLPLVRAIVSDLVQLSREVVERRHRLALLMPKHDPDSNDPYHEELAQIAQEVEKQSRRLQGYVEELEQLGIEPRSATAGVVDFPAVIGGREVYLCWQAGEPEILYWHDPDAGFEGRKPLALLDCRRGEATGASAGASSP